MNDDKLPVEQQSASAKALVADAFDQALTGSEVNSLELPEGDLQDDLKPAGSLKPEPTSGG